MALITQCHPVYFDGVNSKKHWEQVYETKAETQVSWFQSAPRLSLELIRATAVTAQSAIIDVGGGTSLLVDELLKQGWKKLSVLDLSGTALQKTKERLGSSASQVEWIEADITEAKLASEYYDLWHDRAVFHFLTRLEDRAAYLSRLLTSLKSGGFAIIAAFSKDGPEKCSGLDVVRYDAASLSAAVGPTFRLLQTQDETHATPAGKTQKFTYCLFQKVARP